MNPFTAHPHRQGVTYFEHWHFAMGISFRLLMSVLAFAVHALLPSISIKPRLDLEATAAFLTERNRWIDRSSRAELRVDISCVTGRASRHIRNGMKGGAPMS